MRTPPQLLAVYLGALDLDFDVLDAPEPADATPAAPTASLSQVASLSPVATDPVASATPIKQPQ
ncbi:hypothetical protein [Saccharopolyspora pogona]